MDVDVVVVEADERGRMLGSALRDAVTDRDGLFAVVASAGSTNAGSVDELDEIAAVCEELGLWLHIDAAYGGAALCAPSVAGELTGFGRADSFGVDPHKWLFAPYDCAGLVYREPTIAAAAHIQHGVYLEGVDHQEWNPADFAFHLSRRARGLPLWFSLATYGTDAYTEAIETTLSVARAFARHVAETDGMTLLLEPQLSVVLFTIDGWTAEQYESWSRSRAHDGVALVVPTRWHVETCYRVCVVNPLTTLDTLTAITADMLKFSD
jgi:glutamate/tyrosine decarboxylase-like PLP-dependent enzyme